MLAQVQRATCNVTYLRVVEIQQDGCRDQEASPYVDCLDAQIPGIRADHVRNAPLESETEIFVRDWEKVDGRRDSQADSVAAKVE
jgi:hypothetical protein